MKTTSTWMKVKKDEYLDERGARMNFWMIIGNKQIVVIKLLAG
jgi:hypothetical protein